MPLPSRIRHGDVVIGYSALCRWVTVATSVATFGICLTRTAFITPDPFLTYETVNNSALDQLADGWIGLAGAVLTVFLPFPFVLASVVVTIMLAAAKWRRAAVIAAVLTIGEMLARGTLGMAAWLANPMLGYAWILVLANRRRASLIFGLIALGLMLSALSIDEVPFGAKQSDVPILSWTSGYWLWVASAAILVAGIAGDMLFFGRSSLKDLAAVFS